jgi:hypothetical protein
MPLRKRGTFGSGGGRCGRCACRLLGPSLSAYVRFTGAEGPRGGPTASGTLQQQIAEKFLAKLAQSKAVDANLKPKPK